MKRCALSYLTSWKTAVVYFPIHKWIKFGKWGNNMFNNSSGLYASGCKKIKTAGWELVDTDVLKPHKGNVFIQLKDKRFVFRIVFNALWSTLPVSAACPQGTFKSFQGAGLCQQCPLNSRSTIEAATLCSCRNGYYRGDMDRPEDTCTSEYPPPLPHHTHTHIRLSEAHLSVITRPLKVIESHLHIFVYHKHISSRSHQMSNISSLNYRPITALIYYSDP